MGWRDVPQALVRFVSSVSAEGGAKPTEIIESLWGAAIAADTSFARVSLFATENDRDVDPLDLVPLRRPPSARSAAAETTAPACAPV